MCSNIKICKCLILKIVTEIYTTEMILSPNNDLLVVYHVDEVFIKALSNITSVCFTLMHLNLRQSYRDNPIKVVANLFNVERVKAILIAVLRHAF